MKYIKKYNLYKDSESINEEFVGALVKGALSNLFKVFSAPFKDLIDDIKKGFKDGDPNSIKGIVMTNLNQAIDGAQKSIRGNKNLQEGDVTNIMTQFITNLTNLANGIGKDFTTAITDKSKASGANEVAKAILIGSKEAQWKGIIGLLNDPNYKYSKPKYEQALLKASEKKTGPDILKAKEEAAFNFFDQFQKDITAQLDKELTEEELSKIYKDAVEKGGGQVATMDYKALKDLYDKKAPVQYKMKDYDNDKKPEEQADKVGVKVMDTLDDQGKVTFKDKDGNTFDKTYADIIGPAKEEAGGAGQEAEDLKQELTKIKDDREKMSSIKSYTQFLQTAQKDKIAEVEALIKPKEEVEQKEV